MQVVNQKRKRCFSIHNRIVHRSTISRRVWKSHSRRFQYPQSDRSSFNPGTPITRTHDHEFQYPQSDRSSFNRHASQRHQSGVFVSVSTIGSFIVQLDDLQAVKPHTKVSVSTIGSFIVQQGKVIPSTVQLAVSVSTIGSFIVQLHSHHNPPEELMFQYPQSDRSSFNDGSPCLRRSLSSFQYPQSDRSSFN